MLQIDKNSSPMYRRIDWIDVAKGIGIILVVFAHINFTPAILDTIYSFHMPLFFIISGILFNKQKYSSFWIFLKRKLQTLICPYVLFYSLVLIYTYLTKYIVSGFSNFDLSAFANHFLQMFLSQGSAKVVSAPLWFVLCLFTVEILYFFISKIDKKILVAIISAACVVIGWLFEVFIVSKYKILLPWSIDSALFALGFFAIGNLSSEYINITINQMLKHKYPVLIVGMCVIVGLSVTTILAIPNGHVSLGSKILNNGFIFYLTGLIGSLSVFAISALLRKNKFLTFCGKNSFCIMATHYAIRGTYAQFTDITGILKYDNKNLIQTFLPFIVVLSLSLLVTVIYNRIKHTIIGSANSKHV